MVSTTLLMVVLYLVFSVWAAIVLPAKEAFKIFSTNPDNYGSFFMAAFAQALQFGIGVSIILYGVRIISVNSSPPSRALRTRSCPAPARRWTSRSCSRTAPMLR